MRILSCHVTGFGRLVNQTFDFSKNPTVILADNGWGKSTLAAFLTSMFYGLEASRGKALGENLRLKYEPWSGGGFGGSLTFEVKGEKYRIERTFGKTPSGDAAKIYDKNNMLFYGFGARAETLGEALFGVDRESFCKTAYIPQGETCVEGVPDGLKGRLTSLLSSNAEEGNGRGAIARLEEAERALRAKRRPAKGKLDEIDERLVALQRARSECRAAAERAREQRSQVENYTTQIAKIDEEITLLSKDIEANLRIGGSEIAEEELKRTLLSAKSEINKIRLFFGEADPLAVDVDAIRADVAAFYGKTEVAGMRSRGKKRGKRLASLLFFAIGVIGAGLGVTCIENNPILGILLLFFCGAVALTSLFPNLWSNRKKSDKGTRQQDGETKSTTALENKLRARLCAFAFEEIYDYRAALATLEEKRERYVEYLQTVSRCEEKLAQLSARGQGLIAERDVSLLTQQKTAMESSKAEWIERRGRLLAELTQNEAMAEREAELVGEEGRFLEEKNRLEKRLTAIRGAREILMRARESLATRYLEPVEKNCRKYAEFIKADGKKSPLVFAADGTRVFEENGVYREEGYYSDGIRDVYGFSTRIALAEAVFCRELPPLVFDDPFTDMDDKKTEKAKLLTKELSKKYQIVYFTCKIERTL